MAQFIPFDKNVEVNGETVLTIVHAFPDYMQEKAISILKANGIISPEPGKWYKQENWLSAFKSISDTFGPNTLFKIGKAIPENAQFPPGVDSLEKALGILDTAYQMNHRNGEIGYYKLIEFNNETRQAVMECKNPYPCNFDKGIISELARKFAPLVCVKLDTNKINRDKGGDSSWYLITF